MYGKESYLERTQEIFNSLICAILWFGRCSSLKMWWGYAGEQDQISRYSNNKQSDNTDLKQNRKQIDIILQEERFMIAPSSYSKYFNSSKTLPAVVNGPLSSSFCRKLGHDTMASNNIYPPPCFLCIIAQYNQCPPATHRNRKKRSLSPSE